MIEANKKAWEVLTMKRVIVRTQKLKKYYETGTQTVKALDGVDFEVTEREFVSIIGKSGSGKSTLLHMIGGLDTPTSGSVIVDGIDLASLNAEQLALFRRRKVGFIFQQYNLIPDLNVYDNITFPLELDGAPVDKDYIRELLRTLQIEDKTGNAPVHAVRRRATARGDHPGAGDKAGDYPCGRADREPGHRCQPRCDRPS